MISIKKLFEISFNERMKVLMSNDKIADGPRVENQ